VESERILGSYRTGGWLAGSDAPLQSHHRSKRELTSRMASTSKYSICEHTSGESSRIYKRSSKRVSPLRKSWCDWTVADIQNLSRSRSRADRSLHTTYTSMKAVVPRGVESTIWFSFFWFPLPPSSELPMRMGYTQIRAYL